MTEETSLRDRCKKIMMDHLTRVGFPNLSRRQIMGELPTMWKALETAGLMDELKAVGQSYQTFCDTAIRKAQEAAIFESFRRMGPNKRR